jgi:hypothetical protein
MSNAFKSFTEACAKLREVRKISLNGFPEVWIRTLKASEVEDCSAFIEYVDGKSVLQQRRANARRIFYSLCNENGSPFIKTDGEADKEEALKVIESWPAAVVNTLLKAIDELNPAYLSEDDIELGKPSSSGGD